MRSLCPTGTPMTFARALAVLVALAGAPAAAQDTAEEGPKAQQIRAVERGFFFESDAGFTWIVNKLDDRRYGPGIVLGLYMGYDVLPILNVGVGVSGLSVGVSVDEDTPSPSGDLFWLAPMVRIQLALVTTERNFLWIRGDAGYGFGLPKDIDGTPYSDDGPAFAGAVGFERFTKLRHFSVGVTVGAHVVTKPAVGIGVSLLPLVKYTF